jgi:hypothetical protein
LKPAGLCLYRVAELITEKYTLPVATNRREVMGMTKQEAKNITLRLLKDEKLRRPEDMLSGPAQRVPLFANELHREGLITGNLEITQKGIDQLD